MKSMSASTLPTTLRPVSGLHRLVLLLLLWTAPGWGATFLLPTDGSTVVGQLRVVIADSHNTLLDIARHYDLGFEEITLANPKVSVWLPGEGAPIVVPTEFVLPPPPWEGLVVNIPQRRLYYFPRRKANEPATVVTFPIGVSRPGWSTPLGKTRIIAKFKDPAWIVPKDIQAEHRSRGESNFPDYFPPGPNNPMGMLALQTGFSQIFIHGTNRPWGVGMQVSHGCIHLYPENAAFLFPRVPPGTPVRFINQPVMVGDRGHLIYLSVSRPVDEYPLPEGGLFMQAMEALTRYTPKINWDRVQQIVAAKRVIPVPVNAEAPSLDHIIATIKPEKYDFEPYGIEANDASTPSAPR